MVLPWRKASISLKFLSIPDPSNAVCRSNWPHGDSCGDCSNCCKPGGHACPLLDKEQRRCRGYDSFYWRYFNCGRYSSFAIYHACNVGCISLI
jgi:hypothetical protein